MSFLSVCLQAAVSSHQTEASAANAEGKTWSLYSKKLCAFQTRILWRQLSSFLWWPKLGGPQGSPSTGALLSAFDLRKLVENVPVAARCQALEKILPSKPCKVQNFIMSVHEVGYFGTLLWKEAPLSVQTTHASEEPTWFELWLSTWFLQTIPYH